MGIVTDKSKQEVASKAVAAAAIAAAAVAAMGFCNSAKAALVINQVYGDAGFDANAKYTNWYVEITNTGSAPVSLSDVYLEYGSASGTLGPSGSTFSDYVELPQSDGLLAAGGFVLAELAPGGTFGSALPITPDAINTTMKPSFSNGKLALTLGFGTAVSGPSDILDFLGYGVTSSSGTTPAFGNSSVEPYYNYTGMASNGDAPGTFADSSALVRNSYTGNNAVDYSAAGTPSPQGNGPFVQAPEPASLSLIAAGGSLLMARRRRRS